MGTFHRRPFRRRNVTTNRRQSEGGLRAWFASINWKQMRFTFSAAVFCLLWTVLWVRAAYVQLWEGPFLAEKARRQHMSAETVKAPRGMILDRNGTILARTVSCRSVYANPRQVENPAEVAAILAPIVNRPAEQLQTLLEKKNSFVWLARRVDDATAEAIRQIDIDGVELKAEYDRVYPYKHVAGQLLGFVNVDGRGLEGVERAFDGQLTGLATRQILQRDASGRRFYVDGDEVERGGDVRLTLDLQIQAIAEEEIAQVVEREQAKWGGAMVVDVASGEILAWAQYPFFNPNAFQTYKPAQYRNRLALDALEPGSTFKPFLVASALQEGVVSKDTIFDCENGLWKSRYITIRDDGTPRGELTVSQILSFSSNIGCGKIGLELGAVRYHRYLSRLGFGEPTGLPIAQSRGILRRPRDWSESDLISASFGQSVSVTVLQMAQAYLTLANGGVYRPIRLVLDEDVTADGGEQRIFSRATTRDVIRMMEDVVKMGTGKRAAIDGVTVAGKTGTAQKAAGRGKGYGNARTGSFVGLIPSENPKYLMLIFIDEPERTKYGGVIGAPVFKEVATRVMAYEGQFPDPGALTPAQARAQARAEKKAKQRRQQQEETIIGEYRRELAQNTAPAKPVVQKTAGVVPNVVGQSVRRAVEMYARQGLIPEIKGDGPRVVRQVPESGVQWTQDNVPAECVLWLSANEKNAANGAQ